MKILRFFLNQKLAKWSFYLWLLLIVVLTIMPRASIPELEIEGEKGFRIDYPLHFLFFTAFGFLLYWYSQFFKKQIKWKELLFFLFIGLIIAIGDEFIQLLVPDRRFNPKDLYSNAIGTLVGFGIFLLIEKRIKRLILKDYNG